VRRTSIGAALIPREDTIRRVAIQVPGVPAYAYSDVRQVSDLYAVDGLR